MAAGLDQVIDFGHQSCRVHSMNPLGWIVSVPSYTRIINFGCWYHTFSPLTSFNTFTARKLEVAM
jgi:hypothetical protein